jgi:1-deoxy-D-xylulose-5-phosphate reductoisomerase
MKRRIAIFGSTGSIGTQAIDVIATNSDLFSLEVLSAHSNADLLITQAKQYHPNIVIITDESKYEKVNAALANDNIKVYAGEKALMYCWPLLLVMQVCRQHWRLSNKGKRLP